MIIVDQFTGRKWKAASSDGCTAIQAKEGSGSSRKPRRWRRLPTRIFSVCIKLAGMTGTAKTEEQEFLSIYNMRTIVVPTNADRPIDYPTRFIRPKAKNTTRSWKKSHSCTPSQPVLVGTLGGNQ
ncbi:MAG: hypothetical protein ACLVJ6_02835 [Merdibacter sp.]